MVIPVRTGFWLAAIAALALAGASCGSTQHAIDTELAKCLPADTLVAAGVNLDRARQSPLFAKLPASARPIADPFDRATYLLVAFNGKELITAARGDFRGNAPAGTTLLSANVAIAGRHPAGSGAPPADLLTQAESVAVGCFPTRLLGPRRRSRCRFGGTNPIRLELLAASRVGPAAAHPRGGPASCLVCSITVSPLDPGCRSAERPEDETRTWLGEQYGVLTGRTKYFHD